MLVSRQHMMPSCAVLQGLADTFILLGMPFDSEDAKELNKQIFETIYFAALETSCALAKCDGEALRNCNCPCVMCLVVIIGQQFFGNSSLRSCCHSHFAFQVHTRHMRAALSARGSCSMTCGG